MHPIDYILLSTRAEDNQQMISGDPIKDYYMMVFLGMGALGVIAGIGVLALYKGGMYLWSVRTRQKDLSKQDENNQSHD